MKTLAPEAYMPRNGDERKFIDSLSHPQNLREELYKSVFLTDEGRKVLEDIISRSRYYDVPTTSEEAFLLAGARNVIDNILLATRGAPITPFSLGETE